MNKIMFMLVLAISLSACDDKDHCLDSGGHYDSASSVCLH